MIAHLEPEIKESLLAEQAKSKVNWNFWFIYLTGFVAYLLLLTTFSIGYFKKLRFKFFKQHRNFAMAALAVASLHAVLVLYFLILK
ncbi:hypothetical protein TST_1233 [Thermosulfidibacter takaii ABI70S6]|uniref:Ferric oxidoreductase domain-containing protein n=1 Tax=Thermosulfidibacter takaii (strain DSM 17441 / JCM 13301 / NBRC 103674 / ABI70S6) TaxID=1298851 RepID=A0A0S3QUM1_THET7|nr:hypothetical protein [Thermosulfidibacter takaii]BAT72020.1 hypothetical protein TST_1233 [Thermosulfidibacter takaii ABI70S6]